VPLFAFVLPSIFKTASLILLLLTIAVSFWAWSSEDAMEKWILKPDRVWHRGEVWRLLTSGFVHKDYAHLGFNLFTFTFFGFEIERVCTLYFGPAFGALAFLLIYVGGILIANLPTLYRERNNSSYASLGASGGVSAVLFASIVLSPLRKIALLFIPVGIPGFIFGALYAGFSFAQARRETNDGINHEAHLAGALYGLAVILLLLPHTGIECLAQITGWFRAVFD
jgi:membrane associated rhomboid family serine protease